MEEAVELRCNKKIKKTHDPIDYSPAYSFLPRDLVYYILLFFITGVKSALDGKLGRMFDIKIVDGVFIMKQIVGYTEYPCLFLWSNDELKMGDVKLLWDSDIRKCTSEIFAIDMWIHHMSCVGDFEFVYFRKLHFGTGYRLQTLVKNSTISLFTDIMSTF